MKTKLMVAVMFFAVLSRAQTSNPTKPSSNQSQSSAAAQTQTKPTCPCCEKMADGKSPESCCAQHHDQTEKKEMSCCQGKDSKDGMSCAKSDGCCSGEKCSKELKGCCDRSKQGTEQAKMSCCGGEGPGHCGMGRSDHGDMSK